MRNCTSWFRPEPEPENPWGTWRLLWSIVSRKGRRSSSPLPPLPYRHSSPTRTFRQFSTPRTRSYPVGRRWPCSRGATTTSVCTRFAVDRRGREDRTRWSLGLISRLRPRTPGRLGRRRPPHWAPRSSCCVNGPRSRSRSRGSAIVMTHLRTLRWRGLR